MNIFHAAIRKKNREARSQLTCFWTKTNNWTILAKKWVTSTSKCISFEQSKNFNFRIVLRIWSWLINVQDFFPSFIYFLATMKLSWLDLLYSPRGKETLHHPNIYVTDSGTNFLKQCCLCPLGVFPIGHRAKNAELLWATSKSTNDYSVAKGTHFFFPTKKLDD